MGDLISSHGWVARDCKLFSGLGWETSLFWDRAGGFINIYWVDLESYVLIRVGLKEVMSS